MEKYGVNDLTPDVPRILWRAKDIWQMKSFSLVPHNDNSLLIINSGMAPSQAIFYRTGDSTQT